MWTNYNDYLEQNARWLQMEGDAERARVAQRRQADRRGDPERSGETIVRLRMLDYKTGLAGRILLDFGKSNGDRLPMSRLKVGSPVILSDDDNWSDEGIAGVVSRRTAESIQVAVERWPECSHFRIDLAADETTRRRQLSALGEARDLLGADERLRDCLIGLYEPRFHAPKPVEFQTDLNEPQQDAVRFALSARDFAIIHGPPGTGKTTTLAEIVYQCVSRGEHVLVCAPSNTAVDNLLERIVPLVDDVVRVGHPARVFESLRGHTLDEIVESDHNSKIVNQMRREVDELIRSASRNSRSREANRYRAELYAEASRLRQEAKALERSTIRYTLNSAAVICTTTTIDEELLSDLSFDTVVIDEACQCTEPAIWQPMLRGKRLIFAGDHFQLPPTVVSDVAARQGFAVSAMERLVTQFGPSVFRRLVVQYRMNEKIMRFSSDQYYDGQLIAHDSVAQHQLQDLSEFQVNEVTQPVMEFWDTAGADWLEELEDGGESKFNRREAAWVVKQVRELIDGGLAAEDIAVIAPYAAQVRHLRNELRLRDLEIDTVDGFQGREKEAVIVSLVRSNSIGEIGFLADTRRTNVALTRARRYLRVIGDSSTLGGNKFYASMMEYFESIGGYRTVWELGEATMDR